MTTETVIYRGIAFSRYPDSQDHPTRVYYQPEKKHRREGVERLHREVYKDNHGPIPEGFHVHHIDGDHSNNNPSNLEAISPADHQAHHGKDEQFIAAGRRNIFKAQAGRQEWLQTDGAQEFLRDHYGATLAPPEDLEITCENCGESFRPGIKYRARWCSRRCLMDDRRKRGVDRENRDCQQCGATYSCAKSSTGRTCSAKCAAAMRYRHQPSV